MNILSLMEAILLCVASSVIVISALVACLTDDKAVIVGCIMQIIVLTTVNTVLILYIAGMMF
jgi:hypothetical protein